MRTLMLLAAIILLGLVSSASAVPPNYDGRSAMGAVYINADRTEMRGTFGVRFRPVYNHNNSYIKTSFDGWKVIFQGYDSSTRRAFYCWSWTSVSRTYPWDQTVDMALAAGNGTTLIVTRYGPSEPSHQHNCKSVRIEKDSNVVH